MKRNLNIVVAGKSGAGKSSLLNYIAEKDIFETGIGTPITQDYFNLYEYQHPTKEVKYNLYDTKGIEPDTIEEFEKNVLGKIDEFSNSDNFFYHIHTLYFCIAASSKRIEPFEINFIKNISKKVDVVIVLTKSDLVSEEEKSQFKKVLKEEVGASENEVDAHIRVIEVCSVEITTRKGTSLPYGKEDVLNHSFLGLWNVFAKYLSQYIYDVVYTDSITTSFDIEGSVEVYNQTERDKLNFFLRKWMKDSLMKDPFKHFVFHDAISLHSLKQLELEELTRFDRSVIRRILNSSLNIYNQIPILVEYLDELKIFAKNEINDIVNFYSDLALNTISIPVPLQLSNIKIEEIKEIFSEDRVADWKSNVTYLLDILSKDNSSDGWLSSFWNSDIKDEFNESYAEYIDICYSINNEIRQLLNEYKYILQTEIISYGKLIISPLSNNENEKTFTDWVKFALEDDSEIDSSERRFLEKIGLKYNINKERIDEIIGEVIKSTI